MSDSDKLDVGWGFPPRFYENGKLVRLAVGEEDIRESLAIIFSTAVQERLYHSDFGADMQKFMFEEVNRSLLVEVQREVINAVSRYETRIEVKQIDIFESETDAHILHINIDYIIKEAQSRQKFEYTLDLFQG